MVRVPDAPRMELRVADLAANPLDSTPLQPPLSIPSVTGIKISEGSEFAGICSLQE